MTRKLAIVFAVLALSYIANATVDTNSPASVFAVTPGKLFTNGTDTAFTSLTGPCTFTGGFDNTTNYVWCLTASPSSTVPYTFQRRAINASSPATINSTADTKLASAHYAQTNGMTMCSGPGYFGIATGYGTGSSPQYKSDVYFSYAAVNASSFTKVTLTANGDANMLNSPEACFFDNNIFYIVYTQWQYCQYGSETTGCTVNKTQNAVYIQGVNVTSGAVYYNSTGGVKLWSPTSQTIDTINIMDIVGNNQTGYATQGLLLYTDSSAVTSSVGSKYIMLPVTLSTGAAGTAQTLATGATSSGSATSQTWSSTATIITTTSTSTGTLTTYSTSFLYTTSAAAYTTITAASSYTSSTGYHVLAGSTTTDYTTFTSGSTYTLSSSSITSTVLSSSSVTTYFSSTSYSSTQTSGTLTSTVSTTYGMSAFGSLSTYGVVLTQMITTYQTQVSNSPTSTVYANSLFINGSSSASTAANLTNPSGYYLSSVQGFAMPSGGYCLIEMFGSTTSGAAAAVYKDTYYYNGTQMTTSVSLGTYQSSGAAFADATGSIWLGYTVNDNANSSYPLVSAYAGEVLYQNLSASTLSSIFATLAIMIAALFAF